MKQNVNISANTTINAKTVMKNARAAVTLASDKKHSDVVLFSDFSGYNQTITKIKQT